MNNFIFILIILLLIIMLYCLCNNRSNFITRNINDTVIPKIIYKIYINNDGTLPKFPLNNKELQKAHDSWKLMNPGYKIKYYSLNDCIEYLQNNFNSDYLEAFNCIKPYAYKCDFMRYILLYKEGGWYSDWKQVCLKSNLLNDFNNKSLVLFKDNLDGNNEYICNSFMGSIKNNLYLKEVINNLINNIKYKKYTEDSLSISGPGLLNLVYMKYIYKDNIKFYGKFYNNIDTLGNKVINSGGTIWHDNKCIILHKCNTCGYKQDFEDGNNYNTLYNNKNIYSDFNIIETIPKIIYKTGPYEYDKLPYEILDIFRKIKNDNINYQLIYYSDKECYNFIKEHFNNEVVWAYDTLIPSAYKADLFRYCLLYIKGGIYSDLTQVFFTKLDNIINYSVDKFVLTKDRILPEHNDYGIQISFMASIAKNIIYKKSIDKIIENCKNKYYGKIFFDITGPYLFKTILDNTDINYSIKLEQKDDYYIYSIDTNKIIKLRIDSHKSLLYNKKKKHYSDYWNEKKVFNDYQLNYINSRGLSEICNYKPNKIKSDTNLINLDDYKYIKDDDIIYIVRTVFKQFYNFIINKNVKNLTIVLADSDISFPLESDINHNELNKNIINKIYTTNYDLSFQSDFIIPIPLGIDYHTIFNEKLPIEQENELININNKSNNFNKRLNKTYSFFHLNIHIKPGRKHTYDRNNALEYLKNKSFNVFQTKKINRDLTWNEMIKYKWIISPHGNGLDCHRTYEAIALGCIPIVKTSTLDILYKNMPIIIVDNWTDITIDYLNKESIKALKKSTNQIQLNYWKNLILNN